jgi:hypothetical protein
MISAAQIARLRLRVTSRLERGEGEILAVWVDGKLTNPLNGQYVHWTKHRRWAKTWRERAGEALAFAMENEFLRFRGSAARTIAAVPKAITFRAHVAREWDDDGLRAGLKPIRDALKDLHVIDDDRPSAGHVFTYTQIINAKRDARRGVEIRVTLRGAA